MYRKIAMAVAVGGSVLVAAAPALAETPAPYGGSAVPGGADAATVSSGAVTSGSAGAAVGGSQVLPRTGSNAVVPGLVIGLTLVVAGAGATVAGTRRPRRTTGVVSGG
jgi:hypothetical protein